MRTHPSAPVRERLRSALDARALRFAEAVVAQTSRAGYAEEEVAGRVVQLLSPPDSPRPAADLAVDPVFLAALFQNIDLLHADGHPQADALGVRILEAVHALGDP